ncbi:tyrosinase-like [Hemiscyllium ocellatum]|uniref:tyrosinase-like n=1 Tax=Hemiscyllium ocellatum TaxID=170820 RepID=UPI0029668FC7|nr:tyrosinase-like [Hemiscyllium ocellatum]
MAVRLLLASVLVGSVSAQFPRACAHADALKSQTCCPVWERDGSACGEKSGRGSCQSPAGAQAPRYSGRDFRMAWPSTFYRRLCFCKGPFSGFDCGECQEGRWGPQCRRRHLTVRRGLHEMSRAEQRRFVERLVLAKSTVSRRYVILVSRNTSDAGSAKFRNASVYDVCTWVQYMAAKPIRTKEEPNFAHMGPAFAVWHRRYLLFFEREMRHLTGDQEFFLPYWNWTLSPTCDICTDGLMGRNGPSGALLPPSPFANWELLGRGSEEGVSAAVTVIPPPLQTLCTYDGGDEDNFHLLCPGPTAGKTLLTRNPGGDRRAARLPPASDIWKCLQLRRFDSFPFNQYAPFSFRNSIEGFKDASHPGRQMISLHNQVHLYLNGTISQVPVASNDPIFMIHHAFIDKILEDFLRADSRRLEMYPTHQRVSHGHRPNDYMVPFLPLVRNIDYFTYTINFAYTYTNAAYTEEDKFSSAANLDLIPRWRPFYQEWFLKYGVSRAFGGKLGRGLAGRCGGCSPPAAPLTRRRTRGDPGPGPQLPAAIASQ